MRKILFLIVIMIIVVTGCEKNKITCSSNNTNDMMTINQKYILSYSENNITNVKVEKKYIIKDSDTYNSFSSVIENYISNIKSINNKTIKHDSKKTKDSYTIMLNVDMNKVSDEEITTLGLNKNLEEFKTNLESQGLICK